MYATARAAPEGGISRGQKAVFTEAQVPGCPGGAYGREDTWADRQAVRHPPQFGGPVEEAIPGARGGALRPGRQRPGVRAAPGGPGAAAGQEGSGDRAVKKLLGPERMSNGHKVALAREVEGSYATASVLASLELPRSTWYYHQRRRVSYSQKYRHLRARLEAIARRSPEYGYRRTTVELRETYGQRVNRKVVQRLHRMWDLPLIRGTRPPKPSGIRRAITAAGDRINLLAGKGLFRPFEVAYADFTELVYANGRRRAQLIPIVDHATKLVLGWAVGEHAVTGLALTAWARACQHR